MRWRDPDYIWEPRRSSRHINIPSKKIIGVVLLVGAFLAFYILPVPCWLGYSTMEDAKKIGMSCTFSDYQSLCQSSFLQDSIFGVMVAGPCGTVQNYQYGAWIIMLIGFLLLIGNI